MRNLFLLSLFFVSSCSNFFVDFKTSKYLQKKTWNEQVISKLENRIVKENTQDINEFINSWIEENQVPNSKLDIKSRLSSDEVKASLRQLPKFLYDFLDKNIAAIILTPDLNIPVAIQSLSDDRRYLLFINNKINSLGLNDWYRWREYSAFGATQSDFSMEPYLSHKNQSRDTIDFILSQAMGLILSRNIEVFPEDLSKTPISNLLYIKRSWINNKGVIQSHHDKILNEVNFISFYGESSRTFDREKILEFYQSLEKTNFTNLYSTTGVVRDFVESLAIYIHVNIFRRPFHIDFYQKDVLLDSFSHCLNKPRCLGKKKDLSIILKNYFK